jgi:hypothetical protein
MGVAAGDRVLIPQVGFELLLSDGLGYSGSTKYGTIEQSMLTVCDQ